MEEKTKPEKVDIEVKGEIDLHIIDVKKYIGKTAKIESADVYHGEYGYFVKVQTNVIDVPTDKDGNALCDQDNNPIEIRASVLLGLSEDKDGNIGWGKESKTGKFLKAMGVKHYNELPGKEVTVTGDIRNGKTFLSIC